MERDYDQMLDAVKTFVSESIGLDQCELTEQTKIEEDGGIAGLDTITFYETFFEKFNISNPEDFNTGEYVSSDALEIGKILLLFSRSARKKLEKKDSTIQHLTHVAIKQKWFPAKVN